MPDFLKGSSGTITQNLLFRGSPVDGATVFVTVTNPVGARVVDHELASSVIGQEGVYAYNLTSAHLAHLGTYRAVWESSYAGEELQVEALFTVGYAPYGAVTLMDVRHRLMLTELDDHEDGQVSMASPSSVTVPEISGFPAGHFRGARIYVYAGTGRGQERVVMDSTDAGTFIVSSWAVVPDETSRVEVHKEHRVAKVNQAIQRACEDVQARQWVPFTDESILVTDEGQTHYPVPSGFVALHDIYVRDTQGSLTHVRQNSKSFHQGWSLLPGSREIVLPAQSLGSRLVLHGSALAGVPDSDDSLIEIDPEYVIPAACAILLRGGAGSRDVDPDNLLQRSMVYSQLAMAKLKRMGQHVPPGSRRL